MSHQRHPSTSCTKTENVFEETTNMSNIFLQPYMYWALCVQITDYAVISRPMPTVALPQFKEIKMQGTITSDKDKFAADPYGYCSRLQVPPNIPTTEYRHYCDTRIPRSHMCFACEQVSEAKDVERSRAQTRPSSRYTWRRNPR